MIHKQAYKILLVEDELLVLEVYRSKLQNLSQKKNMFFSILEAQNCEEANTIINNIDRIDIAILDLNIPASIEHKLNSGIDIGKVLIKNYPNIKIIVITANDTASFIKKIFEDINPIACLIKNDIDPQEVDKALSFTFNNEVYYCNLVNRFLKNNPIDKYELDEVDIILLEQLLIGTTSKELENIVLLSKRTIEYRKKLLKEKLGVPDKSLRTLLTKAKELKII